MFPVCRLLCTPHSPNWVCLFACTRAAMAKRAYKWNERARMGFIIVIIISMLLFDLCECVLWKSIHTLVPFAHFLAVVTVAIADAVRVLDQLNSTQRSVFNVHELSLYSLCIIWAPSTQPFICLWTELLLIWIASSYTPKIPKKHWERQRKKEIFCQQNNSGYMW